MNPDPHRFGFKDDLHHTLRIGEWALELEFTASM